MKELFKFQYLPVIIFPFLLFFPIIFTGKALFWGTPALQFIPWHTYSIDLMKQGVMPLWNQLNGMGAPLAANYQSALFYPPNWPVLLVGWLTDAGWLAWAHTVSILVHLIWMGFGAASLLSELGYGKLNQVIAGLSMSLCGYFVARTSFFSMIWAGAWIPWVLYLSSKVAYPGCSCVKKGSGLFHFQLTAIIALQLLAGHAQLTWYTWLMMAAWLLVGGWFSGRFEGVLTVVKSIFPAMLLGLGIAAVQLSITAEYLLLSQRSAAVNFEAAMTYSFWPWRLLGFLVPDFFGNPGLGNYWGYASYWEDAVYIGVLPFLMALFTLLRMSKQKNAGKPATNEHHLVRFLWALSIISIVLAMGKHTPIFPFLYKYFPTFDMFNSPARLMVWAEISFVLLAGIGINYWKKPEGRGLYWLRLATAGGFAVTLGAFLAWFLLRDVNLTFIRSTALCGLFALATGLLTLVKDIRSEARWKLIWNYLTIAIVGFDLILASWHLIPSIHQDFYTPDKWLETAGMDVSGRVYLHPDNEHYIKFRRFLQFENYEINENWQNLHSAVIPNLNLLSSISSANNFDPLVTSQYDRWMKFLASLPRESRKPFYNMMNITLEEIRNRQQPYSMIFNEIKGSNRFHVFDCADFVPNDEEAWDSVRSLLDGKDSENEKDTIIIQGTRFEGLMCEGSTASDIQILEDRPDRLILKVSSSAGGWLMISDSWYPGWRAKVNQKRAIVYQGNTLFRVIKLAAGENYIELKYSPVSFWIGLIISLVSVFLVLIILCLRTKLKFYQMGKDCYNNKSTRN